MQERLSPSYTPPAQALTQETPPQDRTPWVSGAEPKRPDILPLPEHLQLNRKQRNDSLVAEFQLSLEEAGGREREAGSALKLKSWTPITPLSNKHLSVPTMPGLGGMLTHILSVPLAGEVLG